jgi:protein gp37
MNKSKNVWWDKGITLVESCSPVSESCEHCWSVSMYYRFHHNDIGHRGLTVNGHFNGKIVCREDRLQEILDRKKPTRWTIWNDLFHEKVPFEFIDKIFDIARRCPQHTFFVLTKQIEKAHTYCYHWLEDGEKQPHRLPENVYFGITCENQRTADERWTITQQIPATKLFISAEPLLENIDFDFNKRKPNLVIIGCENINSKAGRFDNMMLDTPENEAYFYAAVEDIIYQCDNVKVGVFIKQIPINGKVSHEPSEWPEIFRRRDRI